MIEAPLISVIVRSMARPELADALASLAAQDWPDLEVVLVDATGGAHPQPPTRCGPHRILFVPGTVVRPRSVAANAGLDAATGEYIGFLDDDDLLEPGHVGRLVGVLAARPDVIAAYSSAREVGETANVIARRDHAYSRMRLFQDCYLASNSVLFRRRALASARFDERLEVCEDWDFWLQLAAISDFIHVTAETAVMRATTGTSGTGRGPNRDLARFERASSLFAAKWTEAYSELARRIAGASDEALELFSAGRTGEAEAAADSVLAAYPYELAMLNLKATILAMRGEFDGALARFRAAVREEPEDVASHFNLAQALERAGNVSEAVTEYARVLALDRGHPHAMARKAALESIIQGQRP